MAVGVLALFLALSGGVVAAGTKLAKNSVGSGEIRNKSVKGGDLANDTVTGAQIDESSLGIVPRSATAGTATAAGVAKTADRATSAGSADRADRAATAERATTADRATSAGSADRSATAGDADKLGGRGASDFARSDQVFAVTAKLEPRDAARVLVERDGVRLVARCVTGVATTSGGIADVLSIYAESDLDGATLMSPRLPYDSPASIGPATSESTRLAVQQQANVGTRAVRFPDKGITLTSARGTTIFFGAPGSVRVSFNMHGSTCAVTAPVTVSTL